MTQQTHSQMANFIWNICNLLRGPYKRNEYRKVILPLTILRRFDYILEPTKEKVIKEFNSLKEKSENIIMAKLETVTGVPFYNSSQLDFKKLLNDTNNIAANLNIYINSFSPNIRQIFQHFNFDVQIQKLNEKNLLFNVIKEFASEKIDLSPKHIDSMQMGYIFEELIRIGAEQSNEEAGEHFTPREVIKLMVNLLLSPETDLRKSYVVKTIYDPACGTGGMLSVAEKYIHDLNKQAKPHLFGQDWNDEAYATCKSDMLIKGEDSENIKLGCTFEQDAFKQKTFDYMLANPPFGVEWKQQKTSIESEANKLGYDGRFGAGLPRINDGALLFLQHMISKMRTPSEGGSRIGIVFNGSPLFTGDAESGESNIRQWIIENDWLEAIVALPNQLFYNTGISTYIWILTNRKEERRKGKIQLIDATNFYVKMRKSLGNKRNEIGDAEDNKPNQIADITKIYGDFKHNQKHTFVVDQKKEKHVVSKIFDNKDFGFQKITVERPLRLNYQISNERINKLDSVSEFINIAKSKKKKENIRQKEIAEGEKRQQQIKDMLYNMQKDPNITEKKIFKDQAVFSQELTTADNTGQLKLKVAEKKAILQALSEHDESAEICRNAKGEAIADSDLRDTENVPLKENIDDYFKREVLPHLPDAWVDYEKTKIGYEIPLNRHFYVYEPPRELEEIENEIQQLESDIVQMLAEVTRL